MPQVLEQTPQLPIAPMQLTGGGGGGGAASFGGGAGGCAGGGGGGEKLSDGELLPCLMHAAIMVSRQSRLRVSPLTWMLYIDVCVNSLQLQECHGSKTPTQSTLLLPMNASTLLVATTVAMRRLPPRSSR